MKPRRVSHVSRCILMVFLGIVWTIGLHAQRPNVTVVTIDGSINPSSARYIHDALEHAQKQHDAAFVVELNTPGGLLQSTRDIVSDFLSSRIPVVVYVTPRGGQAASAGAFVTLAANIAVMAPGTNIGAAHPVTPGGQNTADSMDISMTKATNDAAALARTIAEKRHRNVAWAESAVRRSTALTETEALQNNVIDLVCGSVEELLRKIDGRHVETPAGEVTVRTAEAVVVRRPMSFRERLLDILSDPNIAYVLMMLGMYGLFFELYNPGSIFPGVVGGICIILAFYSFDMLPLNYAGLALVLLGVILFLLEIKIISHGLLTVGGVISLFLGSLMLFDSPEGFGTVRVSLSIIVTITVCTTLMFLFVIAKGVAIQRKRPVTGVEGIIGERGTVVEALTPKGRVVLHGEYWTAVSSSGDIEVGAEIIVDAIGNLELTVHRAQS